MYDVAARPRAKAGIALAGAAVIAVAPLAPTLPNVHVPAIHLPSLHQAQVELTALTNPLEAWAQVITATLANVGQLGGQIAGDPVPIIQKLIENQLANAATLGAGAQTLVGELTTAIGALPATLQTAAGQLASGDITGAGSTIVGAVLPLALALVDGFTAGFPAVVNAAQNFAAVIATAPTVVLGALLAVSGPIVSLANAGAQTTQDLVDAIGAGDLVGAAGALINAPAVLTGALLNGFGTGPVGFPSPGLLSPVGALGAFTAGTISGLLSLGDTIAAALHTLPTTAAAVKTQALGSTAAAALLSSSAQTVTVDVPKASSSTDTGTTAPASSSESHPEKGAAAGESTSSDDSTGTDTEHAATGKTDDTAGKTDDSASGSVDTSTKGAGADTPKSGDTGTSTGKTDDAGSNSGSNAGASNNAPAKTGESDSSTKPSGSKDSTGSDSAAKSTAKSESKADSKSSK